MSRTEKEIITERELLNQIFVEERRKHAQMISFIRMNIAEQKLSKLFFEYECKEYAMIISFICQKIDDCNNELIKEGYYSS